MSSTLSITPQHIIDNRTARKDAGLVGCISGRPAPSIDLFGYGDVQIWNRDANGNLNGDPGFDRMNPMCFCFDCRSAFDPDAEVDFELIQKGHKQALWTYEAILPRTMVPPRPETSSRTEATSTEASTFPQRSLTHYPGLCSPGCWCGYWDNSSSKRQGSELSSSEVNNTSTMNIINHSSLPSLRLVTEQPSYDTFDQIPTSLPAPRVRDIMNETPDERLRSDLANLRGELRSELVVTMDRRRILACIEDDMERTILADSIDTDELALQRKIAAIDILLG